MPANNNNNVTDSIKYQYRHCKWYCKKNLQKEQAIETILLGSKPILKTIKWLSIVLKTRILSSNFIVIPFLIPFDWNQQINFKLAQCQRFWQYSRESKSKCLFNPDPFITKILASLQILYFLMQIYHKCIFKHKNYHIYDHNKNS